MQDTTLKLMSRDMNKEAWLWYHLTSVEFALAARQAMQDFLTYYIEIAGLKDSWGAGRTDQIAQYMARFVRDYDAAIEIMKHGEYEPIWELTHAIRGAWSGISHSVLPLSCLSKEEQKVFDKISTRTDVFASEIRMALNNALTAGAAFLDQSPEDDEVANRDDGSICEGILLTLPLLEEYGYSVEIPSPTPQYDIDYSRSCKSGETVPWTGVWYPETGLNRYSLAFAIKGQPMQPAYHLDKTYEEAEQAAIEQGLDPAEDDYEVGPITQAVPTTWHPLIASAKISHDQPPSDRTRAEPNELVPKTGWWHSPAKPKGQALHYFEAGQRFPDIRSTNYGSVIWGYDSNEQKQPPKKYVSEDRADLVIRELKK